MTIKYKLLNSGAFVAGDVDTGITSYAYPTSTSATSAIKKPEGAARNMIERENKHGSLHVSPIGMAHDASNWELLGGRE